MPWVRFEDDSQGDVVVDLSGTTLSLFHERFNEGVRVHLGMVKIAVDGPDRKGRRTVRAHTRPGGLGAGFTLKVQEKDWRRVEAFVALVREARDAIERPVGAGGSQPDER